MVACLLMHSPMKVIKLIIYIIILIVPILYRNIILKTISGKLGIISDIHML